MCESADDFYEARYLFTQHSLDHGALPCWVTINKNRRGSINFYTTRYLSHCSLESLGQRCKLVSKIINPKWQHNDRLHDIPQYSKILEAFSFTVSVFRVVLIENDKPTTGYLFQYYWKFGRVADCTGLENQHTFFVSGVRIPQLPHKIEFC